MILDSSAILAFLFHEPGSDTLRRYLRAAVVSTVVYADVISTLTHHGLKAADANDVLSQFDFNIEAFTQEQAVTAGSMIKISDGLSLSDCACLALAVEKDESIVTADPCLYEMNLPVKVVLIS